MSSFGFKFGEFLDHLGPYTSTIQAWYADTSHLGTIPARQMGFGLVLFAEWATGAIFHGRAWAEARRIPAVREKNR